MQDAVNEVVPGAGLVTGLTNYGPLGMILGIFLLVGLYVFKRLFDKFLTATDATKDVTGQKLDALVTSMTNLREDVVSELRAGRQEFMSMASMFMNARLTERISSGNTPPPEMVGTPPFNPSGGLPPPRRR